MRAVQVILVLVVALAPSCSGGNAPTAPSTTQPTSSTVAFTAPATLAGTVGTPFSYSFCRPPLANTSDLCQSGASNPSGGQPPYSFQLDSGSSLPPGMRLNLNGILNGTPTTATPSTAGPSTFSVCAVDLARRSICRAVAMTIVGSVTVIEILLGSCERSATPLPGWRNCLGTVRVNVTKTVQSGFVSILLPYPNNDAYYRGERQVTAGIAPGEITINIRNEYVSRCPPEPYRPTLIVYDGRIGTGTGPVLAEIQVTLTGCRSS